MNAALALAKLKVKNVKFDVGTGGSALLTPEDVAAALAGCNPVSYYLGLYKYSGDHSVLPELEKQMFAHVGITLYSKGMLTDNEYSSICRYMNKWINSSDPLGALNDVEYSFCLVMRRLCRLLIDDVVLDDIHAPCGGTGIYNRRQCMGCNGTGRMKMSDSTKSRNMRVSPYLYKVKFKRLFDTMLPIVLSYEQNLIEHLNQKFRDIYHHP